MVLKYKDIIGLYESFTPVYDLEKEKKDEWKRFIPNKMFYKVLKEVLDSLETSERKNRKSFLIQGTYGTGKSHMTSVIKHLLWDEDIEDFLERMEEVHLKERLKNFRKHHRVFPVVIKGVSNITDSRTFNLILQKHVKESLKKEGIDITTKSDFEVMLYHLKENPANIDFDSWINEDIELKINVKNKENLIKRLEDNDVEILRLLEKVWIEKNLFPPAFKNIREWLIEVSEELKNKGIDYLMIYWDEFTNVLERGLDILTEVQSIAELSKDYNIFLFVVSHRTSLTSSKLSEDDIKKIKDRFIELHYEMEPITTYHILESAIRKIDKDTWEQLKNEKITEEVKKLIKKISGENQNIKKTIENLFPIHPYSAYLSTYIARTLGSANRSVFQFIYDDKYGFKKFIKENPKENGGYFLTCDYLWDYFKDIFENEYYEKFGQILEKYKLYIEKIKSKGPKYEAIFKGILLLNVLYNTIKLDEINEYSLLSPTTANIKDMFVGTEYYNTVDEVLNYLDESGIIQKSPNDEYIISTTSPPLKEVENVKEKLKGSITSIVDILSHEDKDKLKKLFENVLRAVEIEIFGADISKQALLHKLRRGFKKDYSIHIAFFVAKNENEIKNIKKLIKVIWKEEEFRNIIFVVSDVELSEKEFNRWIEYKARAEVAKNHSFKEEEIRSESYAKKIINNWISKIKNGYVHWFLNPLEGIEEASQIHNQVNKLSKEKIFWASLENIDEITKNENLWKKSSNKVIEHVLFADNRDDFEERISSNSLFKSIKYILKDKYGNWIVGPDLKLLEHVSEEHPVVRIYKDVERAFNKAKEESSIINLGEVLRFLCKEPYGLYKNIVSMAVIAYIMRDYIGKLYEVGTGRPIEKHIMRDKIISLFKYWESGKDKEKLKVRFGTEEEEKLINILQDIFNISEVDSLNDIKWKIREKIDDIGYPLWGLTELTDKESVKKAINKLCKFIHISDDEEITYKNVVDIYDAISRCEIELKSLINERNLREGFIKWLRNLENINIEDEKIDEVIEYIRKNMQEKCSLWDVSKVRELVIKWKEEQIKKKEEKIEKLTKTKQKLEESKKIDITCKIKEDREIIETKDYYNKKKEDEDKKTIKNKLELLKEKILKYEGDLKELLITIIENHPYIAEIIERYL
ncbi:DUF6079 family protein [Methanocaldococcus sp.]